MSLSAADPDSKAQAANPFCTFTIVSVVLFVGCMYLYRVLCECFWWEAEGADRQRRQLTEHRRRSRLRHRDHVNATDYSVWAGQDGQLRRLAGHGTIVGNVSYSTVAIQHGGSKRLYCFIAIVDVFFIYVGVLRTGDASFWSKSYRRGRIRGRHALRAGSEFTRLAPGPASKNSTLRPELV